MSQENVEVVRQMFKAWSSGDRDAARAAFDENVVFIMPPIDATVSYGVPDAERAVEAWRRSWEDYSVEVEELIDGGEHVVAISRQRGRGKASGTEVDLISAFVCTLRASKIIRAEVFETKGQALEAAGLSE
ncbi:MAG: SnoaL-like polyketide cyclase [Solirubrobacterales bacterium]|jgi:ketosteroid isomerase-like protein|nr:SnoaL-like polyketide cyclase [Solirubrobacterales bacterium]